MSEIIDVFGDFWNRYVKGIPRLCEAPPEVRRRGRAILFSCTAGLSGHPPSNKVEIEERSNEDSTVQADSSPNGRGD